MGNTHYSSGCEILLFGLREGILTTDSDWSMEVFSASILAPGQELASPTRRNARPFTYTLEGQQGTLRFGTEQQPFTLDGDTLTLGNVIYKKKNL